MTARGALWGTIAGTIGVALAYASAFASPEIAARGSFLMAVAMPVLLIAVTALGIARKDRPRAALALPLLLTLLVVTGSFVAALLLPADQSGDPLWFGLPRRVAIVLYGVGIIPLVWLPVAYARTFNALTLTDADIERVRAARLDQSRNSHTDSTE